MRTPLLVAATFALVLAGCQKPTEVQVTSVSLLDIESVTEPDPSVDRWSIDSTALLPREQELFAGTLAITSMKSDNGTGIESRTFARVVFENRKRPIFISGRKYFYSFPLGNILVSNGATSEVILPRERRIGNVTTGFEYMKELSSYLPNSPYRFTSTGSDSVMAFSITIETPENLSVSAPTGGQRIARDRDVEMRWAGRGDLAIIISVKNAQGRLIPLLNVKPRINEGRGLLSKRILNALPRGTYVMTFVLSKRDDRPTAGRYSGRVLVRALSIYNIRVDLI